MSLYDTLVTEIREALKSTQHGQKLLASWTDSKIKQELKEPCFFGVKQPIKVKDRAVRHFERIASFRK